MKKSLNYFFTKERELRKNGERIYGITLTSPVFPPPLAIRENVSKLYETSFPYMPSGGDFELRRVLADHYSSSWSSFLEDKNVFVGNGGKEVLFILLQTLLKDGGEAIIISPYWSSYPKMVKLTQGSVKIFKTFKENRFYPDIAALKKQITDQTKVMIVNSPCNPTGKILREKDVKALADLALEKNITLIADEVYEAYDFENHYCSFLKYFNKNIFTVFSASKIFCLCGWRLGWGFGNEELVGKMIEYQANLSTSPHSLSQISIREFVKNKEELKSYFSKIRNEVIHRRDFVASALKAKGVEFINPEGGIAMFIKIPESFDGSFSFCQNLLEKEKVAAAPGKIFGEDRYIRVNLAVDFDDLKETAARIVKYYDAKR